MSGAREAVQNALGLGAAAVRHASWWLRWQTGRPACREVTQPGPLPVRTAGLGRRAA